MTRVLAASAASNVVTVLPEPVTRCGAAMNRYDKLLNENVLVVNAALVDVTIGVVSQGWGPVIVICDRRP